MAYNPSVAYVGPDGATRSVTNELTARFGYPARPYEFVTGWKDAGNVSGHNPDSDGITHGVDIFMTQAQNRWAADHLAARGRAGDPRVAYVIYAGQIASPSTGYEFAGSGWEHWDHPHLSVWDGYWGGYCSLPAHIYNDTSSWGIAGATPQANTITPIPSFTEMDIDMATPSEVVTALMGHPLTLRDGTKASLETHLVNLFGDTIKRTEVLTSFDGKTKARVVDILANLGPDVRAIKTKTDKLK
ncbi:hypothetical protein ART_1626 [Arthrobacter sp. PAMC 25486]|uniref:hypothetical protein n=1 Tax=Arthrobacter sp. PAMC 25486 TaxID=1494608 RepID=UPI000535FB79|nr:hypothetical protein [Arthrobacter sp. PAMC 25486]AIY01225.1 hypothetical protein ART_1626 [Arthrobacter sp. PAMC 25486]